MARDIGDYNQGEELIEVQHESTNCTKLARDLGAMTGLFFCTVQIDFCKDKLKQHKLLATDLSFQFQKLVGTEYGIIRIISVTVNLL